MTSGFHFDFSTELSITPVKRVADGLTDKASTRAKKILPAGALLWACAIASS